MLKYFNIKASQTNTYKMKLYLKSSLWANAATWLPASVLHTGVGLASQQSVTSIYVFGFVIHCSYVKICSGLFHRMQDQFLSMIPLKKRNIQQH